MITADAAPMATVPQSSGVEKEFWTVRELARRWVVSSMTVQKWIRCGVLQAYRFPGGPTRGMYRVRAFDLHRFERDHLRTSDE